MSAMHLEVPARAARGDAIHVQISGDGAARPVTVSWLGREHVMAAQPSGGGWQAEFLLPVPLDSNAKSLALKTRTQDGQQAEARVALFDKKRPVQPLGWTKNMWIHRQRCRSASAGTVKRPARP